MNDAHYLEYKIFYSTWKHICKKKNDFINEIKRFIIDIDIERLKSLR